VSAPSVSIGQVRIGRGDAVVAACGAAAVILVVLLTNPADAADQRRVAYLGHTFTVPVAGAGLPESRRRPHRGGTRPAGGRHGRDGYH
jgi:hypothetical protein